MTKPKKNEFPLGGVSPDDTKMELACGSTRMVLLFLADKYGESAADEVANSTRMNRAYLEDRRNWVSQDYYYRFLQRVVDVTGDPNAPFLGGTYASKRDCFGPLATLLVRLGTVGGTYALQARLSHLFVRTSVWNYAATSPHSCTMTVTFQEHDQDRNNCLAIQGGLVALPELHGCPRATLRHTQCACDGHPECVYELSWVEKPAQIRALVGALSAVSVCGGISAALGWPAKSLLLGLAMGTFGYVVGHIFDYATRLQESYRYNKQQAASLEESMQATEKLNEELQGQVEERTEALRVAYAELEESKTRELAQQRVATIGVLASGMAHELNTPLNTIQMALQGIQKCQPGSQEWRDLKYNAWRAASRCSRIVGELLAFSREPQTVSLMRLHEVVEGSLSIFEHEMPEGITIFRAFDEPPPLAHVDGAQIQQALLNLLNNASDAVSQKGLVTVRMRSEDDQAVVEVADDGPGIGENRLQRVFEPFESTKRETGAGLGLGLSIASELVKKNRGAITVVNQPDSGACFSIHFPLAVPGSEASVIRMMSDQQPPALAGWTGIANAGFEDVPLDATLQKPEFSADAIHILLVEDDAEAGLTLKRMLELEDVRVTHVATGTQGVEAFDADRFDAVVTDVLLGDMTGVDLLRAIRKQDANFPVILLTGHDSIGSAIEALRLGAQDYIQKPLEQIEALANPVRAAVKHHKLLLQSKALTESLRVSEVRFRSLAELLPETVLEADLDGRISFLNASGMERFGVTEADIAGGYYLRQGVFPEEAERVGAVVGRILAGEMASGVEFTGMHKSGETFPVLTFSSPVYSDGRVVGLRSIVIDITRQKASESEVLHYQEMLREMDSQLQITEERERCSLAADLHDSVAQLLAATKMRIGLANRLSGNPEVGEHLGQASKILADAITQTRSLVFQLSPPSLYTQGIQTAIHDLTGHMLKLHGLQVVFTDSEDPVVLDEKAKIHAFRAVRELLVNVAKHAGVTTCSVSIDVRKDETRVIVEDEGNGFDTTPVGRGSARGGFGLFGIGERLKTVGGRLILESEPGKGTRATVAVPA